ncbi:DUF58 domain-containing protein [Pseudomonas sp.]|uniref:DUF58 domain-containing protein n=1 Tax=Pseudomonas sp. TaxID=306 RepID=UPI002B70CA95|nr:DUF58 domain-containing protein [Pseudomonas sp.]HUE90475.1 DUF58 domain-containing protein [Pseudomonas sp.]
MRTIVTPPPAPATGVTAELPGREVPTVPTGRAWPVPTWRLAAALILVGLAVLPFATGHEVAWVIGNLVVLGAAVADAVLAPSPSQVGVRRDVEPVMVIDSPSDLRWTLANPVGRRLTVDLADALPGSLRVADRRARLRLPPRGSRFATRTMTPARRGTIELGAVTLRVHGPLGLMMRQADCDVTSTVRVHPAFPSRQVAELALHQAQRQAEGLRTIRLRGQGTDFESLREYTTDDESRRIDWAATARALKPIVRTYRAERNQQILVLLDHGRTMAGRMGRLPLADTDEERASVAARLEHAMDAVMALTRVATGMGDRVGLVAFSDEVGMTVPPRTGGAQMTRIVQALADVGVDLVEPDYRAAFAETLVRYRRRALVVVVTDLAAAPITESLVPAIPLLARRHLLMVASPADPTVRSWSTRAPRDAAAAYRMASALKSESDRRRSARLLGGVGAQVIDEPPDRLPLRLIDAYLDLKSAGRL